jgi:glycosyltransferase involved in cell wall biosynthesis
VVTEALARGLPVVATRVGGVPEALGRAPGRGVPGLLVPPESPAVLADALARWVDDRGLRTRLRTAAAARRGTLSGWDRTASGLSEVLVGVRGRSRAGASGGHR